jgi:hypothetical protein
MRAWQRVHFSLVAYRRRFYNILTKQFYICVRMLVTFLESPQSARDIPVTQGSSCARCPLAVPENIMNGRGKRQITL